MSLAYKLYEIGSVLSENDIKKSIKKELKIKDGKEPIYLNINFKTIDDETVSVNLTKNSIEHNKLFFSQKIGGSGTAIYYLYPDISIQKESPIKKINQVKATLKHVIVKNCKLKHSKIVNSILNLFLSVESKSKNNNTDKMLSVLGEIKLMNVDDYIVYLTINGKTFYELMPEIWDNWYKAPVGYDELVDGYDIFTNKETKVGYKTDFKVFSYDQYDDSLNHRLIKNLSLSLESAKNIKFAWIYILHNLVFYYKELEYVIIPNLISRDKAIHKTIIERLVQAKNNTNTKKGILKRLKKEEQELKKKIKKLKKKNIQCLNENKELKNISLNIENIDIGMIKELNEQLMTIDEHINSVTVDYLFTSINKTNKSFEIHETIKDVIPSRISEIVKKMREYKIDDLVKFNINNDKTYLQDFFNRNELCFIVNKNTKKNKKPILTEKLYLAKLLLTNTQIKMDELLKKFDFNRLYDYGHKKKIENGTAGWIKYSSKYIEKENNVIKFLASLNKIRN